MKSFTYNDMEFSVEKAQDRWDISCRKADGNTALVAAGLFAGLAEGEAEAKAKVLVRTMLPVGIRSVGPDVAHPALIGDMKLVGPDVTHPNFIYWDKDSTSFPR
jgi:hypothetical protein